jgi:hypothetical protein
MTARPTLAAVVLLAMAAATPSQAQTAPDAAKGPRRAWDVAVGVQMITPASLGTLDADLTDPAGAPVRLFRTTTDTGLALGLEANIGTSVSRRFDVEFSGAWTRFDVRSRISDDFEDVPAITVSETLTRFSAGGAVLWRFVDRPRTAWFVRGGVGWMRELSSDASLVEDGLLVDAGVGVKYWLSTNAAGDGRFGLRAEFRVLNRRQGIEIDDGSTRLWPVVAGTAVFRF